MSKSKPNKLNAKKTKKAAQTAAVEDVELQKYNTLQSKGFFKRNLYLIVSFFVPAIILYTVFAIFKVGPFGDSQILVTDLWHQYYPFLCDFQDKLQSGGSFLYTWKVGLGTNFLALMSYYLASPLNFLCVFVPHEWLREFLAVAVALKVGFAGLFFAVFAKITFKRNDLSLCVFSVMYALSAYIMGYYWNVIWLDTVALLPLVVAGTYALLKHNKFRLFVISLALSILANYYVGLFTCVFVLLFCICYQLCNWNGFKDMLYNVGKMALFSVIAIGITAALTLPTFFALQNTHSADNTFPSQFTVNIGTSNDFAGILVGLQRIIGNTIQFVEPNAKDGVLPNVYCGILSVVMSGLFFTNKKIKLSERLCCGGLALFLALSCIIQQLNYMWHGFHVTNMLPYRFSFLLCFVLVYMAFRTYMHLDGITIKNVIIGVIIFAGVVCCEIPVKSATGESFSAVSGRETKVIIAACVLGAVYLIWIALYSLKIVPKKAVIIAFCLVVLFEMSLNAYYGVKKVTVTQKVYYPTNGSDVEVVVDKMKEMEKDNTDLYRAETTTYQTLCDGALNNYNGISQFSSMANSNVTAYLEKFGTCGWVESNRYTYQQSSPVTNLFLNLKYLISRYGDYNCTSYFDNVATSGQVKLLKNKSYLPMGFLTNSTLSQYNVDTAGVNPFDNQNQFFKLATGTSDDVYQYLDVASIGHSADTELQVTLNSFGHYTFTSKVPQETHLKYNYYLPEGVDEGTVCVYANITGQDNLKIYRNDQQVTTYSYYNKRPFIIYAGDFKAGDKISVWSDVAGNASGSATVYCTLFKDDVYEKGYTVLSKSTLNATKVTQTKIEGTINCDRDGLFYTSIPYENGWTAYVDGEKCEIKPLGNALITFDLTKGEHTVVLKYSPEGFVPGLIISLVCIAILVAFSILFKTKFKPQTQTENTAGEKNGK